MPPAAKGAPVNGFDVCVSCLVPATAVFQVNHQCRLFRLRESIAMQSNPFGCSHFGEHAIAGQRNAVIARTADFAAPVRIGPESRRAIVLASPCIGNFPDHRHNRDVEKISDARPAKVRMGESYHSRISFVIARTPVPGNRNAGRAELNHTERYVRTDKYVTVTARADTQIDIVRKTFLLGAG